MGRVGLEDGSHTLGVQSFEPAALPGEGLPGAGWRERSTKLELADAGSAATHGLICRLVVDLPAPVASLEAALETETAQAATVEVSPAAVALAEQGQCGTGEAASRVLVEWEAPLLAATAL
jgi:hypothetical protein